MQVKGQSFPLHHKHTSVAADVSTCVHAYLFDVCVIKVHPPADLSLEEESGVMFPVVAHHPDQVELGLPSLLLGHPVEQLQRGEDVTARRRRWRLPFALFRPCFNAVSYSTYIPEAQAGSQGVDDVLGQVRVIGVPHQADGDDLRTVEEDASHPQLLTALTLRKRRRKKGEP